MKAFLVKVEYGCQPYHYNEYEVVAHDKWECRRRLEHKLGVPVYLDNITELDKEPNQSMMWLPMRYECKY